MLLPRPDGPCPSGWGALCVGRTAPLSVAPVVAVVQEPGAVLADLRRARRRQRLAEIHWIDALYQVYVTAIAAGAVVLVVSGLVGGDRLDPAGLDRVLADGPTWLGLGAAVAVALGLRSGARGGPLALEAAEARHVLLAPIDRRIVLRGPAVRQLRFVVFAGAIAGAVVGQLAVRRLGGAPLAWVASGAAFGVVLGIFVVGTALVASGRRLRPAPAALVGLVLVAWPVAELATGLAPSPTTLLGRLAFWPLDLDLLALGPVVVAATVVAVGLAGVGGTSVEAAERRTSLVGQLKFAVTVQDLRTVLVLRRQLAMEVPRRRPWLRFGRTGARPSRLPVTRRAWRSVLRWPLVRVARLAVLGASAGLALRGAWAGTTPLLAVAGLALFVAALDAVEPLAQEIDHPSRREALPVETGWLLVRHLLVPAVVMVGVALVGAVAAVAVDPSTLAVRVAAACVLPAAVAAVSGAVVSTVMGAPDPTSGWDLLPPEIAGARSAYRTALPPLLAVLGTLPLLAAKAAHDDGLDPVEAAGVLTVLVVAVAGLVVGWVRVREPLHAWWADAMAQLSPPNATAGDDDDEDEHADDDGGDGDGHGEDEGAGR